MNRSSVTKVEDEMAEVRRRIADLDRRLHNDPAGQLEPADEFSVWDGCKETAALRRASMNLTRALAEMRRSKA